MRTFLVSWLENHQVLEGSVRRLLTSLIVNVSWVDFFLRGLLCFLCDLLDPHVWLYLVCVWVCSSCLINPGLRSDLSTLA